MGADQIVRVLRSLLPELERLGVTDVRLFGSHARGDASPTSDIDVLVTMSRADFGLYCRALELLETAFGRRVDLVMMEALKPEHRSRVLKEAVRVA